MKHPDRCTACGSCVAVCKYDALSIVERTQDEAQTYDQKQTDYASSYKEFKEAFNWLLYWR